LGTGATGTRSLSLRHTTHSTHLGVDCETREAGHGCLPDVWEQQGGNTVKTKYTVAFSMLAGVAIGVVAVQGLQAQGKPKAYTVSETELIDATAQAAYTPLAQAAQRNAGARPLRTGGGKIVAIEGAAPPKRVAITEWDSLEQAQAFYNSAAWKDLAPQRDKGLKLIRRYAVEAMN
jgi:uncharacterized protein (DUF1330 family)